ncbi:TonB-dependent receptor [Microbulbifer agarilyticus]|uniref:TonB-dependent receptor n=1 Tax=Microbulbifer agarilyticus TaxID=260552 RepID=UPI001CD5CC3B|nr:TonB-dependent receptor [Microbulbifer agarilyticus]MCA0892523.1 TonB-dependent receptor [Microbulbifer agarilyticus]
MKQANKQRFTQSTLASAVAAVSAGTLFAVPQISLAQGAETVEEIIVTATRRAQSVQDIPYNISAVSGDELEASQITDAAEMMRSVPGLTVVDRGYRNSGTVNGVMIRGVNVDSGSNGDVPLSAVPTVATYVDDTPLYANFVLKDIERVEVLRGPQGTLYGSGSLAGTVRYIMNKPKLGEYEATVGSSFSQTEGSDGFNMNSDVLINVPLGDTMALRANVGMIDNDGIVDYTNVYELDAQGAPVAAGGDIANGAPVFRSVEDADTVEISYARAALLIEPNDQLSVQLSHQMQSDEIGGRRQVTRGTNWVSGEEEFYDDYENGAVTLEPSERDVSLTSLEISLDMGFATFTSSTSSYSHDGIAISDNSGFYAQNNWFANYYGGSPRPLAQAERFYDDSALVQEIRLVSNGDNFVDWVAGFFYMNQDSKAGQNSYMPGWAAWAEFAPPKWGPEDTLAKDFTYWGGNVQDQDFYFRRNQNFTDAAIFGETTFNFSDTLRMTLGLRHFDNKLTNDSVLQLPIWPAPEEDTRASFTTKDDDTLLKANVSWDMSESTMLYATISEGYRRGGANAVPLMGGFAESPEYLQYGADQVMNYELGVKGTTDAMRYTVSLFRMDWTDPQLNTATSNWGFFAAVNGDEARTQGLEVELNGDLSESISYNFGYAFVDAELTKDFYQPSGNWQGNGILGEFMVAGSGTTLPGTAEHTMSLSLDHTTTVATDLTLVSRLSGYYQSETTNAIGSGRTFTEFDGFQLWNASSTLVADDWDVTLFAKNLFNEDGVTGALTEAHMGTDPAENFYGNASKDYISLPRTLGVSGRYHF